MNTPISRRIKMFSRFFLAAVSFSFIFNKTKTPLNFITALVGFYYLFNLQFYLPFLDEGYFPLEFTQPVEITNVNKIKVELKNLPPNTKVIFWAAEESATSFLNPLDAYSNTKNVGISKTNENGFAELQVRCPSRYFIPKGNRLLPKHVHYRYELSEFPGMYSQVYTKNVEC
jgi:hypothetical protein